MPVTEAPPKPPSERPLRRDLPHDPAELHLLIEELEDERERVGVDLRRPPPADRVGDHHPAEILS